MRADGWQFPYVSTYGSEFPFDFGLALTEEQAEGIPEIKAMVDDPPDRSRFWSTQVGAELKDGFGEPELDGVRRERTVYHPTPCSAPDPFVAPFFNFLRGRTPNPLSTTDIYRKDEYPD